MKIFLKNENYEKIILIEVIKNNIRMLLFIKADYMIFIYRLNFLKLFSQT